MCIIFHNPDGRQMNKEHLRIAYENNEHGFGIMWVENGRLNTIKGIAKDFEEIWALTQQLIGLAYTLHLRWRTTGLINIEQCHPFHILSKDNDGLDFSVMHNGTINEIPSSPEKSDTQLFSEHFRDKILEHDPCFKLNYIHKLENTITKPNKMVFMTNDGRIFFVNKHLGKEINGIWYSNIYSIQNGYRKKILKIKMLSNNNLNDNIKADYINLLQY